MFNIPWLPKLLFFISCILSIWIGAAYGFYIHNIKCIPFFSEQCFFRLAEGTILLKWVDDPGTFILGCIAAVGTGVGAILLYNQVRQADRLENFRRGQKHKAQRALMPLRLSEIYRYVETAIKSVEIAIIRYDASKISRTALLDEKDVPKILDEPIEFFSIFIEYSPKTTTLIEKMISIIQYQDSRISELSDKERSNAIVIFTLYSYYIEYCILQCIIDSMYNYGRGRSDELPVNILWDNVIKKISFRSIPGDHLDKILAHAHRLADKQGSHVALH